MLSVGPLLSPGPDQQEKIQHFAERRVIAWGNDELYRQKASICGNGCAATALDKSCAVVIPVLNDLLQNVNVAAAGHRLKEITCHEGAPAG